MRSNKNCHLFLLCLFGWCVLSLCVCFFCLSYSNFLWRVFFLSLRVSSLLFGAEEFNRIYGNHSQSSNYYYETLDAHSNGICAVDVVVVIVILFRQNSTHSHFFFASWYIRMNFVCIFCVSSLLMFCFSILCSNRLILVTLTFFDYFFFSFHRMLKTNRPREANKNNTLTRALQNFSRN